MLSRGPTPVCAAAPLTLGDDGERLVDGCVERCRVGADLREDRPHDALGLVEQRLEQVLGFDRGGAVPRSAMPCGGLKRLLRLDGQLVESHVPASPLATLPPPFL